MKLTYWQIGRTIVEDEQDGKERADYGKSVLKNLAQQLTLEFGKGFWEKLMWGYQQPLPWAKEGEKWLLMDQIFQL